MASKINRAQAESLIQEYRKQNAAAGDNALKTHEGHNLNGFFLDRESLEKILQDPTVAGVHVHLAKHPDFTGKPDNVHTLVYSGSVPTEPGAATPFVSSSAEYYTTPPPCPPYCPKV